MLAARAAPVDPTARHVLMVIASHANRKGRAWPSMDTLATETGRGRRTVERAVDRLEAAAVVEVIHRAGRSCEYVFAHEQNPRHSDGGHPADPRHSDGNPRHSDVNPRHSDAHKDLEELCKNVPDGPLTNGAAAGEEAGPVAVRALLAGMKQHLAGPRNRRIGTDGT